MFPLRRTKVDTKMAVPDLDPSVAPYSSSSMEWAFLGIHCGAAPTMLARALRSGHISHLAPRAYSIEYSCGTYRRVASQKIHRARSCQPAHPQSFGRVPIIGYTQIQTGALAACAAEACSLRIREEEN